jgi:thiol-disulfide isomerase/thioredoxin
MKYITGIIVILCLQHNVYAQKKEISSFYIGDRIPDLSLENIINYKDSVATLSSFGDKIIILDFWNIHCTSCIRMFPLEDALQAMFPNDVQFILITSDNKEQVTRFLTKYNGMQKRPLSLPVITGDRVLSRLFRFTYIPHYVWLAPNGLVLAASSDCFVSKENIANTLAPIREEEARLQGNKYADFNLHMQKPTKELLQLLSSIDN